MKNNTAKKKHFSANTTFLQLFSVHFFSFYKLTTAEVVIPQITLAMVFNYNVLKLFNLLFNLHYLTCYLIIK